MAQSWPWDSHIAVKTKNMILEKDFDRNEVFGLK